MRHFDTYLPWIQPRVKSGDIHVKKIDGAVNCADALTKHVDRGILNKHIAGMNLNLEKRRAETALQWVASLASVVDCAMLSP